MILNSNIFASWLQFYPHPDEVPELEKANDNALVTIKNGAKDIENEVIASLMDFPTSLISFGEVENNGTMVMAKVVHHFFKKMSTDFPSEEKTMRQRLPSWDWITRHWWGESALRP